jgi:CSLREA domain-containing protein
MMHRFITRYTGSLVLIIGFLLLSVVLLTSQPVSAATFTVTKTADTDDGVCDADCSLREAITAANAAAGDDTITFATSANGTITLAAELPSLSSNITIDGNGAANTVLSGGNAFRLFFVASGATVTIQDVTIANGRSSDSGGGIRNDGGTLTVTDSTFSSNTADFGGGGGGIFNASGGTLTVTDSAFSANSANFGGGIGNVGGTATVTDSSFSSNSAVDGGGIANSSFGTLTVTNSSFSGNSANDDGGGIANSSFGTLTVTNSTFSGNSANGTSGNTSGGGILNIGTLTVTNSTFSGNSANGTSGNTSGGGIANSGNGTLTVAGSTFSGNRATGSGGNTSGGGILNIGTLTVTNSTLSGNSATDGGGVANSGAATLNNTIVANSTSGGDCFLLSGSTVNASHSLIEDGSCGVVNGTNGNLTGDPNIDPTTLVPNPGSPVIDAGSDDLIPSGITTDLAGNLRIQGLRVDMGAFETAVTLPDVTISAITPARIQEGSSGSYTLVLDAPPNPGETVTISLRNYNTRLISPTPTFVQFTNANWNVPRTITLLAVNDSVDRGVTYAVSISHVVTTTGGAYTGITASRIRVYISDNDLHAGQMQPHYDALNLAAWLDVVAVAALVEDTSAPALSVRLNGQPMPGEVVIVELYAGAGLIVTPSFLIFDEANWNIAQTVTLTARSVDGTRTEAVQVTVAPQSSASSFIGAAQAVTLTILDETAAPTVQTEQPIAPFAPVPEAPSGEPEESGEGRIGE